MLKITRLISICLISLFLIACNQSMSAPSVDEAGANTVTDLTTLPKTIDVDTASSLQDRDDVVLIDVREQWEYDEGHIPGITLIPMSEIETRLSEIPQDKTIIVTCRSGNRSGQVHTFLEQNGFDNTHNMAGGILAWEAAGLEVER